MRVARKPFWLRVLFSLCGEVIIRLIIPITLMGYLANDYVLARQVRYAESDPERAVFGSMGCGNPCVVNASGGGYIRAYVNMATRLRIDRRLLIINGPCFSACAILADFARPLACITPNASFHFHMRTVFSISGVVLRIEPPASARIRNWVMNAGGFPYVGFRDMEFKDAVKFWPICTLPGKGVRIAAKWDN